MDTQTSTIRYVACGSFDSGEDHLVCVCGWFEEDHDIPEPSVMRVRRLPLRTVQLPERRAS